MNKQVEFLVGDNAFHGISHLSQQRARERLRNENPSDIYTAARLVNLSLENGANGFLFTVSETTLSILKKLEKNKTPDLYAIVPYAYEYVRLANKSGGVPGLSKKISKEIIFSRNVFAVAPNLLGILRADPSAFLKTYLIYEVSRINSAIDKNKNLRSILLHEVITDMALALDLDWLFKLYIDYFRRTHILPGFETRNFPYLLQKFREWKIDLAEIVLCAAFNKIGFQMNPSQKECEKALQNASEAQVIAMSILAAGYIQPIDALNYLRTLPNLKGVVVGVSKEAQAKETFNLLRENL